MVYFIYWCTPHPERIWDIKNSILEILNLSICKESNMGEGMFAILFFGGFFIMLYVLKELDAHPAIFFVLTTAYFVVPYWLGSKNKK